MAARAASFVDRLEVDFSGTILSHGIVLGDADNDGLQELVVGNTSGQLIVLRGAQTKPWRTCSDLGMISCVDVGDICNKGKNYIVCLTGEGSCHLFYLAPRPIKISSSTDINAVEEKSGSEEFKPVYTQHLNGNARRLLIVDADNDGANELVVAHTDRHVRMYRWQDGALIMDEGVMGRLEEIETWQMAGQIGSLSVHVTPEGRNDILVSQPGGTYVTLLQGKTSIDRPDIEGPCLRFHPFTHTSLRNASIGSVVLGNIRHGDHIGHVIAVQDGSLLMVDDEGVVKWTFEKEKHFAYVQKLDFSGNGSDAVLVCSFDGCTYILDHLGRYITFQLEETVAAFCCGFYAYNNGKNVPCLIYVTHQHKIYVYYDVILPNLNSLSLLEELNGSAKFGGLVSSLGMEEFKGSSLHELTRWCLYGRGPHTPEPS